jgi:hypothetical protein
LPSGFIEQHAGGDCCVQALDRAGAGNVNGGVSPGNKLSGYSIAFVADDERNGPSEVGLVSLFRSARESGEDGGLCAMQAGNAIFSGRSNEWHAEDASGRGADSF